MVWKGENKGYNIGQELHVLKWPGLWNHIEISNSNQHKIRTILENALETVCHRKQKPKKNKEVLEFPTAKTFSICHFHKLLKSFRLRKVQSAAWKSKAF